MTSTFIDSSVRGTLVIETTAGVFKCEVGYEGKCDWTRLVNLDGKFGWEKVDSINAPSEEN